MAMAVATLGPKELKLRAQRQAGGNEVARRYSVPVKKISLAQAREKFPTARQFLYAAADKADKELLNAPQLVKQQQQIEQAADELHIRAAARAEAAQIRVAELEAEVSTLKRELAKRGSTGVTTDCPVCTARKEANRLSMRKKRHLGEARE
jgi:predicted  nucleic acid-binding Zn ribbon protein